MPFSSPQAVLAAVIIVNLKGMLKQFSDICSLWKANRVDLVRSFGSPGLGLGPLVPMDLLTPSLLLSANLAGDLCGHNPAEPGHWPGSVHRLLPAACGGSNAAVSYFWYPNSSLVRESVSHWLSTAFLISLEAPHFLILLSWSFLCLLPQLPTLSSGPTTPSWGRCQIRIFIETWQNTQG